jgi:multimeric flavodoxin WrbA
MKVLGISGSPRPKGNSHYLMSAFMDEMIVRGHDVKVLDATKMKINRCIGCGHCEKKGICVFNDDFTDIFLPAVIEADVVALCSPVYFYAFPADIKALIDRIQVLWSRKYRLKTNEFDGRNRKGVLLAVGATRGKDLFSGMQKTARYFFDAACIDYAGSLCYRGLDEKGEMETHPAFKEDVKKLVSELGA